MSIVIFQTHLTQNHVEGDNVFASQQGLLVPTQLLDSRQHPQNVKLNHER